MIWKIMLSAILSLIGGALLGGALAALYRVILWLMPLRAGHPPSRSPSGYVASITDAWMSSGLPAEFRRRGLAFTDFGAPQPISRHMAHVALLSRDREDLALATHSFANSTGIIWAAAIVLAEFAKNPGAEQITLGNMRATKLAPPRRANRRAFRHSKV
jgi:hypothetical protein